MRENITFLSTTLECLKASQDKNELRAILLVLIAVLTNKSTIKDGLQNLSSITKSTFESKQSSLTNLSNADFNVISNADKSSNSTQHKQVQKEIFTTIFVLCGEIFCAFREKIYAILTRGDILDCSFLYLSFITPNVLAEHFGCGCDDVVNLALDTHFRDDERFLSFVNIADKMLCLSASQSQEEWIMLVELGSISRVLAFPSAQYRLKTNKNTIKTSKIKTSPFQKTSKQTNKTNPQHIHKTKNAFVFFSAFISLSDMQSASAQKIQPFIYEAYELFKLDFGLLQEAITLAFFNADNALKRRNVCNWQLHIFWNVKHWFNSRKWLNLYGLWKTIFYERIAQARGIMDSIMQESSHYQHHFKSNAKGDLEPQPSPFSNLQPLYQAIDEVLYLQLFIYHFCGNSFVSQEQWREFNNEVLEKSSALYREFGAKFLAKSGKMDFDKSSLKSAKNIANHQLKSSKTIIGFLRDRMVENSPFKVEYSLIKNLINCAEFSQKYEIKIYCMSLIEKSENDPQIIKAFAHLGVEIIDIGLAFNSANFYNSHLQKALALREIMLKDNIEVLISPNNGYGISDFLLSVRCAPTQVFWTHGNFVYDIVGIDGRLTHICNDLGEITHEGVKFGGIPVKMDNVFYNPPVLDSQIASAREHIADLLAKQSKFVRQHKLGKNAPLLQDDLQKLRKNAVILGVMGRLTKIDSIAYLEVICEILARRKECVFVACGMGNEEVIKEKITHINAEVLDRFCFTGQIDSAVYGHIIDVWCDSFPMEQGESRIEYVAKGKGLALKLYDCDEGEFLERLEEELDSVESVISEILCEGNSSLGKGNSPAGSHCIDLAVCHEARTNSALTSCQTAKNSTSTTSLARIVGENSSDICHTEGAQATEVSQIKPSLAESSLDKNPQDSRGNLKQNDKTNSPSLAEGVRGRVDSNAELSLQDSESERGKTRQSRSFFSNLNGIASDFKNAQLKIQGDCHAQQVALAMTEKRDCHESAYADSRNDEKTREFNADFDKSISNDNVACRPEGVGKNARSILKTQNRDFSLIAQNDNDRDISGLSPQYGKDIECYDIDCVKSSMHNGTNEISTMPKSLHFTLKARANTNALLANAKAQITGIIQSLLENQTSISPNIRISNQYSAWANQNDSISNATSPILQIIIDAYKWRHCEVGSIHAGLECGILQERFKQMGLGEIAMASIGPSIFSPHSLQERLDLGSFEEFIEVLKCALDNICTQNI